MSDVIRTWKSNGDKNRMSEDVAVKNLEMNAIDCQSPASTARRRVEVKKRLRAGESVETPLAIFRMAALIVLALLLTAFAVGAQERLAMPQWEWRILDAEQITLWRDGVQQGNYFIETGTYLPYLGARKWGVPEDPPCPVPAQFLRQLDARKNWRTQGVISPEGKTGEVPHTGLHIRKTMPAKQLPKGTPAPKPMSRTPVMEDYPPAVVTAGAEKVPDYSQMGSLTFVSNDDGTKASAAKQMFETAPELEPYRQRYGRVKAYSYEDFKHTSYAFKLDQDMKFQQTGFVALAQPDPPDATGAAKPTPIYAWDSPAQAAGALRDARPDYDPNDTNAGIFSAWETPHLVAAGTFITVAMLCGAVALGKRHQARRLI